MIHFGIDIIECFKILYNSSMEEYSLQNTNPLLPFDSTRLAMSKIGHTHKFYHFIYVIDANNAYIKINLKKHTLVSSCVYMVKPDVLHEIIVDNPYALEMFELKFSVSNPDLLNIINYLPEVLNCTDENIFNIIEVISKEYKTRNLDDPMKFIKTYELLLSLKRLSESNLDKSISKINLYAENQDRFSILLEYITHHFMEQINVSDMADIMHNEKCYFIKQFKKCFNMTPMNYLNSVRINRSLNLLEYTQLSIAKISEEIGFASQNSFYKAFKKTYSLTPNEYRMNIKKAIHQKYV